MFRRIVIGVILFSLILIVVACTGPTSPLTPALTPPPPAPAAFQTADLAINPAEVNPAVEVTITAQVTNTNDTEGTYAAGLMINDVSVATMDVTMAAGESKPLSFAGAMATPGTYKVAWAELVGEFLVPRLPGEFVVVRDEPMELSDYKTTAPDFTAVDVVTSETISLSQFSGSTILLNFVNLGCSSSLSQIVSAQLLAIKELREQRDDFIPISVFCGCCSPDVLRENSIVAKYTRYLREYGYPTLVFIDKDQNITEVTGYVDISTLSLKIDEMSQ